MKYNVTISLTYQESLVIRHSLDCYAEKWKSDIRELRAIIECEDASTEIKERCATEILELDKIRIFTQRLWLKVSNDMYGSTPAPEHISTAFQDPDDNE